MFASINDNDVTIYTANWWAYMQDSKSTKNGGVFLLRQSGLTDLAWRVCRSFIRPSVSFLVF